MRFPTTGDTFADMMVDITARLIEFALPSVPDMVIDVEGIVAREEETGLVKVTWMGDVKITSTVEVTGEPAE